MGTALALAVIVGVVLGAIMAHWAGRWPDRVLSVLALIFYSTPGFWIGLLAIVLFSVRLGWLPSGGNVTIGANLHGFAKQTCICTCESLGSRERTAATNHRWRRVFSARIDMTLKRGRHTSAWVARSLGVSEGVVGLWRAGVMVPNGDQCARLSKLLRVDLQWLCAIEDPVSF